MDTEELIKDEQLILEYLAKTYEDFNLSHRKKYGSTATNGKRLSATPAVIPRT